MTFFVLAVLAFLFFKFKLEKHKFDKKFEAGVGKGVAVRSKEFTEIYAAATAKPAAGAVVTKTILQGPIPGSPPLAVLGTYEPPALPAAPAAEPTSPTTAEPHTAPALLDGFSHLETPAFMRCTSASSKELQRIAKLGTQAFEDHLTAHAAQVVATKAKAQSDEARKLALAEKRKRTAAVRKAEKAALDAQAKQEDQIRLLELSIQRDQQQSPEDYEPYQGHENSESPHPEQ